MNIKITINTDHAAFHPLNDTDTDWGEVARILRSIGAQLVDGRQPTVRDYNGNTCGLVTMEEE